MSVIPPVSGVNVGHTTGGGFLDTIKSAMAGATGGAGAPGASPAGAQGAAGAASPAGAASAAGGPVSTKGDGSIGLFDGVLLKAGIGGAAGALAGWVLPFGGPLIGGVVGALGGAVMGVFGNWKKMNDIKKQNQAMLDQMGVGTQDPQVQQILQSGQVQQLVPMAQQEMSAGYPQQSGAPGQYPVGQTGGVGQVGAVGQTGAVGQFPQGGGLALDSSPYQGPNDVSPAATDPTTSPNQSPVPTQTPVGTSSPAKDASIYTGDVPPGFPGAQQQGAVAQGVQQQVVGQAPPVPQAVYADPTAAQYNGAGSIMGVQQASATLGSPDQSGVPVGVSNLQQDSGIPPAPAGYGGGATTSSAQVQLELAQLQAQIVDLKKQLAALPPDTTSSAGPSTQTAVPAAA